MEGPQCFHTGAFLYEMDPTAVTEAKPQRPQLRLEKLGRVVTTTLGIHKLRVRAPLNRDDSADWIVAHSREKGGPRSQERAPPRTFNCLAIDSPMDRHEGPFGGWSLALSRLSRSVLPHKSSVARTGKGYTVVSHARARSFGPP